MPTSPACARLGADARALGRLGARVGATFGFAFALLVLAGEDQTFRNSPYLLINVGKTW